MRLLLSESAVYPWTREDGMCFRGYFIYDEEYYAGAEAICFLRARLAAEDAAQVLPALNGVFSVIWQREGRTLFAVDRLRALPLFYCVADGELCLGDSAGPVAACLPAGKIDPVSEEEYRASKLFVTGASTLLQGLFQVQAACYCLFPWPGAAVQEFCYFQTEHNAFPADPARLTEQFRAAYAAVGARLVMALRGRTAVLPLSGGADSRMVLQLLKQAGYQKIICYTYGRPGNAESAISRKVAAEYGCPWFFVPYTGETWTGMRTDPDMRAYQDMAFNFTSTPHVQDFPAVKWLKENGKLPADSVFVPGHSGDFLAGSHITSEFMRDKLSRSEFLHTIYAKFFDQLEPEKASPDFRKKLDRRFPLTDENDMELLASQSEWFNTQERQAKFIVNSVRVYEYFGYEWLIPLWDNVLFEFWRHVPLALRYKRRFYFAAVGQETVASTNTPTAYRTFLARIRATPGLRTVVRKGTRILRYWRSSLRVERLFPLKDYLWGCLRESDQFHINTLICYQRIADSKALIHDHEKT